MMTATRTRVLMSPTTAEGPKRLMILCDLDPALYALGVEAQRNAVDRALEEARDAVERELFKQRSAA